MTTENPKVPAEIDAAAIGSVGEAVAAMSRLLSVTEATYERRAQLEQALRTRIVIEQAKGILAERYGLTPNEAFDVLRRAARSGRVKVRELAAEVAAGRPTPPRIAEALESLRGR